MVDNTFLLVSLNVPFLLLPASYSTGISAFRTFPENFVVIQINLARNYSSTSFPEASDTC